MPLNTHLIIIIGNAAEHALAAGDNDTAYILGILCGSLQRGDTSDMAKSVEGFVTNAVRKQTLQILSENSGASENDLSSHSKN